jgi:Lon protease-like protein
MRNDRATMVEQHFRLFPLPLVVLPGERIPLHIFEQRYRTMIGECIEDEREFGIVWLAEDELKEIGCACVVERVLERMDDGRFDIIARGTRPFQLIERADELPYPAGTVEFVEDGVETPDADAADAAHESYATLVNAATDRDPDPADLAGMTAYAMAATIEFGFEAKQRLLELRSENARLALLTRLVRAAMRRLEFVDRAQTRALSNGKVRFG